MNAATSILTARDVRFQYRPGKPVLRAIDFTAEAGSLVGILGPNGSGKTTLLKCLLGWITPSGGEIALDSRSIRKYSPKALARRMAYVPQFPTSAFGFLVGELVLMGRFAHTGVLGLAARADLAVAKAAMEMTETLEFADRTLDELSGGEAQRVMIARALAQQPSVMLLDEPTSHLDIANQLKIYRMMQRVAHEWPMAVVCVSHDINLAARFADQLVLMREGEVLASGPPAEVIREDVLQRTYGVRIGLIPAEGLRVPIVVADAPSSDTA